MGERPATLGRLVLVRTSGWGTSLVVAEMRFESNWKLFLLL